jgi:AraC-like DNA-binding protein
VRLGGSMLFLVRARTPWMTQAPPARQSAPAVPPPSRHPVSYHVVTAGHCRGGPTGDPAQPLQRSAAQPAGRLAPLVVFALAALRDPLTARALGCLHRRPAHPWTPASLAACAGRSRSTLAEHFARVLGRPPMQDLQAWRMQLAAGQRAGGRNKVCAVAEAVGYRSEAAFSRAFRRDTGLAPGAWHGR